MTIINGIILGLIRGAAEFLPISAAGHMSIVQNLFGLSAGGDAHALFDVLLRLGALLALCLVLREDLIALFNDCVTLFTTKDAKLRDKSRLGTRQVLMLIISCLPMLLILPVYGLMEELQSHTVFVGLLMILTGCMLYVAGKFLPGKKDGKNITLLDAIIIGVCRCIGVLPGLSPIAASVTAAMCCGVEKEYAVKYSLLLAVPAAFGSTIISVVKLFGAGVNWAYVPAYLIGTAVALLTAVLSIGALLLLTKNGKFDSFRHYCWGAGVIAIFLTAIL
ncbi:MAG: undecaprenyl-diphosphate phosphatase [Oscillospiraceae bacterium]|nr:undecaprenyl-diphosphate phosphatase [Oscillospiraceae bacterium]